MVIAYHLVFTAYGWWLPNDPRGSTSTRLEQDILKELGELHFGRKKVQPTGREIRAFYDRAADLLEHELLEFDDAAIQVISGAVGECIKQNTYTCYAGVIMPDHAHLCVRKHKHTAEEMIERFQRASAVAMRSARLRAHNHPVWSAGGWKVFLDSPDDIWRTIPYIENNPLKIRRRIQRYPWVTAYNNWPRHLSRIGAR